MKLKSYFFSFSKVKNVYIKNGQKRRKKDEKFHQKDARHIKIVKVVSITRDTWRILEGEKWKKENGKQKIQKKFEET